MTAEVSGGLQTNVRRRRRRRTEGHQPTQTCLQKLFISVQIPPTFSRCSFCHFSKPVCALVFPSNVPVMKIHRDPFLSSCSILCSRRSAGFVCSFLHLEFLHQTQDMSSKCGWQGRHDTSRNDSTPSTSLIIHALQYICRYRHVHSRKIVVLVLFSVIGNLKIRRDKS